MPMDLNETLGYQIKSVWHSISKMYNQFAEEYGLTFTMALVLLSLDSEEGMPSTHIGPTVGLEPRSLTRLLKRMEGQDLIKKKQSKEDKRQVFIQLTPNGIKQRKIAKAKIILFNEAVRKEISAADLEGFNRVLGKIKILAKSNIK